MERDHLLSSMMCKAPLPLTAAGDRLHDPRPYVIGTWRRIFPSIRSKISSRLSPVIVSP
jgi:hypothetical protein